MTISGTGELYEYGGTKETLINTFLPFFKMYSKTETRTFFKTAKRTLRFNQRFPNTYNGETYTSAEELTAVLDSLEKGATGTITYSFVPSSKNYTTPEDVTISFEITQSLLERFIEIINNIFSKTEDSAESIILDDDEIKAIDYVLNHDYNQ
ncbi:MAG: hypothetical protein ACI4JK_12415 [Oscillospiraceae bacterium]